MNNKKRAGIQLALLIIALVLFNILMTYFHWRLDLTSEHRYTLNKSTEDFLEKIEDDVYVTVFLKGDFPAGFRKLADATQLTLSDFRGVVGKNFRFQFIDPMEGITDPKAKEEKYKELAARGIIPTELQVRNENDQSSSIIFPKALVNYLGKEVPVNLLEERYGQTPQEQLNASESLLEYKFAKALSVLSKPEKDRVVILSGQNESLGWESYEALNTFHEVYNLDTIDLSQSLDIPTAYKVAILIKPARPFTEKEKFVIDQYVMHGGKMIWLVEKLFTNIQDLQNSEATMAVAQDLNLDDQLFKYGARINANYIQDMSCNPIPVITGESQGQPKTELLPWVFYPILMSDSKHPISHNMDAVMSKFACSIDTIENDIKKTVLLHSSEYSRTVPAPVRVSLSMLKNRLDERYFDNPDQPVAVLLEGKFESLFDRRLPAKFLSDYQDSLKKDYLNICQEDNKMVVISDADIILNDVSEKSGPLPWGYYNFTGQHFANPEFILNCIDYLVDDNNIMEARSKDIKLRVLDLKKAKDDKLKWQLINILIPILLVIFFGSAYMFFRRRKYEGKSDNQSSTGSTRKSK